MWEGEEVSGEEGEDVSGEEGERGEERSVRVKWEVGRSGRVKWEVGRSGRVKSLLAHICTNQSTHLIANQR